MRVLIVEDDALIALGYQAVLKEAGHECVGTAASASAALKLAANVDADVALVDLRLADGVTGNAVAVELSQAHRLLPIIITANLDMVSPAAKLACFALLPKPLSYHSLRAALDAAQQAISVGSDRTSLPA
ncbi:response regulator [Arenibaculum pallidiluteum]|uniref:response regulator n=1 Tax=Arenibaculum pallidiluteum TaxID=2812559 RepID=UPI001A974EAF|nr:response regulator [Arenibaculum pallidiluteum]